MIEKFSVDDSKNVKKVFLSGFANKFILPTKLDLLEITELMEDNVDIVNNGGIFVDKSKDGQIRGALFLTWQKSPSFFQIKKSSFLKIVRKYGLKKFLVFYETVNIFNTKVKNKQLYLAILVVDKEYRNLRIGHTLLDYAEKYAKEKGFTEIYLHVIGSNRAAAKLYLNSNYKVTKTITSKSLKYINETYMEEMTKIIK